MRPRLKSISISGFKSIRELNDFAPEMITVLIGPNGAGKSNLISFFRLLSWSLAGSGNLREYVARQGGASALLHDGSEVTKEMRAMLSITTDAGENNYEFSLAYAARDSFVYTQERYQFIRRSIPSVPPWRELDPGHTESRLIDAASSDKTAETILSLLRKIIVHQFHNTSDSARMRTKWKLEDDRRLKEDAGNLAPFLFRLYQHEGASYRRIVDTIRLILPFFDDFVFEPDYGSLLLKWREFGSDRIFDASQAADGMLRAMALIALLLQPERDLPDVLIIDEPELGLHPYAIDVISGLLRSLSEQVQVILATQSVSLIDRFDAENIVVVDRRQRESQFRRLNSDQLLSWLDNYTLSELWEKNVVGGRP